MVHRIVMTTSCMRPGVGAAGAALLTLLTLVAAGDAGAQQRIDQRMAAAPVGLLRIQNFVGAVRVTGWDRDSIAVTGTVGTGEFYFGVGKGSGKLGVYLPPKVTEGGLDAAQAKGQIVPSVLEVRVPRRTRVWVKTARASIDVQDVTGRLDLYAVGFEDAGARGRHEGCASEFGARFYGLPENRDTVTLLREEWRVPETIAFGAKKLVPLRAGETVPWKLA